MLSTAPFTCPARRCEAFSSASGPSARTRAQSKYRQAGDSRACAAADKPKCTVASVRKACVASIQQSFERHDREEMMAAQATPAETPKGAWTITFLLFLLMLVNFADKIVVGLAAVPIMTELNLKPAQFGLLGSSFFLLFSIAVHAIYKWFPDEKRTLPTAILSQGSAFGVILAVPAMNWLIVNYSWHYAFGALGVVGVLWAVAWLILGKEGPLVHTAASAVDETRIPYSRLLTSRTFVGCVLTTFGAYWALSLGLTWFTSFIIQGLGFTQQQAGFISILPWIFGAAMVILTGWFSQVLMARGVSTRGARGVLGAAPLVVGGAILAVMPHISGASLQIALLVVGAGLCGSIYVVCPPMLGEFTPVSQRGAVIAIYGALFSLAGIIAPYVMGNVIQGSANLLAGYMMGFTINAFTLIGSGVL